MPTPSERDVIITPDHKKTRAAVPITTTSGVAPSNQRLRASALAVWQSIHNRRHAGTVAMLTLGCSLGLPATVQAVPPVAPSLDLSSSLDGSNGFVINGVLEVGLGASVSGVGDINDDGIDDLIIGAPRASDVRGRSFVVFGSTSGFDPNLGALDGSNGFVIRGIDSFDESGQSVSGAGDVNDDGINDLIIGAPTAGPGGNDKAGESYVVFGSSNDFASDLDLSSLDGSNGFVINGIASTNRSGTSVSNAGDVNGDGIDDVIIGAPYAGVGETGQSYVVFGKSGAFASSLDLSSLDGSNGFVIDGVAANDSAGTSVSNAGDVNGDGIDDVIIGARFAKVGSTSEAGQSYVVFGKNGAFASSLDLSSLDGSNGFVINGIGTFNRSGTSVSNAGDVNGDSIDDVIIGAPFADVGSSIQAGRSYVVFGKSGAFASSLDLSSLDGSDGFSINGIDELDRSGMSVSSAADVNGDGVDDLIIGAANANAKAGESYVVFGTSNGFASSLNLSALDGSNGFVINNNVNYSYFGKSVSSAGDINGDGIDDVIIGAPLDDPHSGLSYVVFMPLADTHEPDDTNSTVFNFGETRLHSIAPVGDRDRFIFFVSPAQEPASVSIQTANAGTPLNYDSKITLLRTDAQVLGCSGNGTPATVVASNDNIDAAADQIWSRVFTSVPCGNYELTVESALADKVIPAYAVSLNSKPIKIVPPNKWQLLSLPDTTSDPSERTVGMVFGDDLDQAAYGDTWNIFTYDPSSGYSQPALADSLPVGQAFWMIQSTGTFVELDTPMGFGPPNLLSGSFCESPLCFANTTLQPDSWNMIGAPLYSSPDTNDMTVVYFPDCQLDPACSLQQANTLNILSDQFFRFDGNQYRIVGPSGETSLWHPWDGMWSRTLPASINSSSQGTTLLIPGN